MGTFLDSLSNLSEDEIRADLARIQEQREELELKEGVLRLALDLAAARRVPTKTLRVSDNLRITDSVDVKVTRGSPNGATDKAVAEAKPPSQPTSKRGPIKSIMRSEPAREWTAPEIHEELERRGIAMSKANTRVTLRRMAKASEVHKVSDGRYVLTPAATTLLSDEDAEA